jgi:hypothetical protein
VVSRGSRSGRGKKGGTDATRALCREAVSMYGKERLRNKHGARRVVERGKNESKWEPKKNTNFYPWYYSKEGRYGRSETAY